MSELATLKDGLVTIRQFPNSRFRAKLNSVNEINKNNWVKLQNEVKRHVEKNFYKVDPQAARAIDKAKLL